MYASTKESNGNGHDIEVTGSPVSVKYKDRVMMCDSYV